MHVFDSTYSDNGTRIESWILTKQYHISEYITAKLWRFIDVYLQNVLGDLTIDIYTDGVLRDSMVYSVGGQVGVAGIGVSMIGVDMIGYSSGTQTTTEESIRMRISRGYVGRTCQIKLANVANGEHFDFLGMGFWYRHRNQRAFDKDLTFGGE